MSVTNCKKGGRTSSCAATFGLSDDLNSVNSPAYISENTNAEWIAEVENPNLILTHCHAIDNCIEIQKPDGNTAKRCDCVLFYENNLLFVELKDCASSNWKNKAREQLTDTIAEFKAHYGNDRFNKYTKIEAYICNKQKPLVNSAHSEQLARFYNDTKFTLNIKATIKL